MSEAKSCGAVFRLGANAPATCALRPNHDGPHSIAAAHRPWARVAEEHAEMVLSLRSIRDGYDHDGDAHKYSTMCRRCEAGRVLALVEGKKT